MSAESPRSLDLMAAETLDTTAGDLPLVELELVIAERTWRILHSDAVLSHDEEQRFLRGETAASRPYGVVLWPAAIAMAHELASRDLAGLRVLELGAGTGLPGLVAAARGAQVVQTDRQRLVLHVCERNAALNGVTTIVHRVADWTTWDDAAAYDLIIGSDVLYAPALHPHLRHVFEHNLAPSGTVLLSDPLRAQSLPLLEAMERGGWHVALEAHDHGDQIVLSVRNQGPPIPSEDLLRLFEPFETHGREGSQGLGLGLYIVSEIVRAHGGTITVSSTAEAGTAFITRWPRKRPPRSRTATQRSFVADVPPGG